jgi:hypothetical protein
MKIASGARHARTDMTALEKGFHFRQASSLNRKSVVGLQFYFLAMLLRSTLYVMHHGMSEMLTGEDGKPRKFHKGNNEIHACLLGAEPHGMNLLA